MVEPEVEEYESDPEDAIALSSMRRREASDDEAEDDGGGGGRRRNQVVEMGSDRESAGAGGAPASENEEEEDEAFDEEYGEEIEEEEDEIVEEEKEKDLEGSRRMDDEEGEKKEGEGEKENEPFAVPTAGAFYMHDDRFQENGRGRSRRMPGGRRLWESKDDRAWVHDRFEEMKLNNDRSDQGRRNSRGRFRGRGGGRHRDAGRAYVKGNNRPRGYYDDGNSQNHDGNSQNRPQKSVRGRGPRRYEPTFRNNEVSGSYNKQPAKTRDLTLNTGTGKPSSRTPNVQPNLAIPRKNAFGSSLNSASPPFYPSGSSKQDLSVTQKRDAHVGNTNKIAAASVHMGNNFLSSQSGSAFRGKAAEDSFSHERKYTDDSLHSVAGRALASAQVQSSVSSLTSGMTQFSQFRAQGRNLKNIAQPSYQSANSVSQVPRAPQQLQAPLPQQRPEAQIQHTIRVSTQQVVQQRPSSGNQISSPHAPTTNASEVGETNTPSDSNNSKTQLFARGKTGSHGAGRGSFLYNGAHVIGASGAMGLSQNDQNFPGTPALLPVMQFGGQHPGGIPALGMAFPGYVAQPQQGLGSSEMTWVPVLASAAGALGASYPCIALDRSYYPRPSGQASSAVGSRETIAPKPANTLKPPEILEVVNDEFVQRQNKPRRYSEMNFGQ